MNYFNFPLGAGPVNGPQLTGPAPNQALALAQPGLPPAQPVQAAGQQPTPARPANALGRSTRAPATDFARMRARMTAGVQLSPLEHRLLHRNGQKNDSQAAYRRLWKQLRLRYDDAAEITGHKGSGNRKACKALARAKGVHDQINWRTYTWIADDEQADAAAAVQPAPPAAVGMPAPPAPPAFPVFAGPAYGQPAPQPLPAAPMGYYTQQHPLPGYAPFDQGNGHPAAPPAQQEPEEGDFRFDLYPFEREAAGWNAGAALPGVGGDDVFGWEYPDDNEPFPGAMGDFMPANAVEVEERALAEPLPLLGLDYPVEGGEMGALPDWALDVPGNMLPNNMYAHEDMPEQGTMEDLMSSDTAASGETTAEEEIFHPAPDPAGAAVGVDFDLPELDFGMMGVPGLDVDVLDRAIEPNAGGMAWNGEVEQVGMGELDELMNDYS